MTKEVTGRDLASARSIALEHAARLASVLHPDALTFEYNSRQSALAANDALVTRRQGLGDVVDGRASVPHSAIGIA